MATCVACGTSYEGECQCWWYCRNPECETAVNGGALFCRNRGWYSCSYCRKGFQKDPSSPKWAHEFETATGAQNVQTIRLAHTLVPTCYSTFTIASSIRSMASKRIEDRHWVGTIGVALLDDGRICFASSGDDAGEKCGYLADVASRFGVVSLICTHTKASPWEQQALWVERSCKDLNEVCSELKFAQVTCHEKGVRIESLSVIWISDQVVNRYPAVSGRTGAGSLMCPCPACTKQGLTIVGPRDEKFWKKGYKFSLM